MRTLGIIPARAGSKRLPGKNMRLLGGKQLVRWVIEAAEQSKRISQIVVSSDDPEVLELAGRYGLQRPAELATDYSPAIDYVRDALSMARWGFDAVCILQPSSPLTTAEDIDGALEMLESSEADSVVTVCKVPFMYMPHKVLRMHCDYVESEELEARRRNVYVRNGSVYAARLRSIMCGEIIGRDCLGCVMPRSRSIDINDEEDLAQAEQMLGMAV